MFGFETLTCLHEIPVVRSSTDFVQNVYSKAKNTTVLIRFPCSIAETIADKSLKVALTVASPLVQPFRRPVHAIDEFAAEKIRQFERKYPVITTKPDDVFDSIQEKTEPVRQAVHSVKYTATSTIQQGKEKFSNVASATMNTATGVADSVLSYYSSGTTTRKSNPCRIGQLKSCAVSTVESVFNYVFQSAQSKIVWLRLFIITNLIKVKQTNDCILSSTGRFPLLNIFSQRFLIFFGSTLETIVQRLHPDSRGSFETKKRESKKYFATRGRCEPDPSFVSRPDVIDSDQHVFPLRSSEDETNEFIDPRSYEENADIEELHRRVKPTPIEQLYSRVGTDIDPVDDQMKPLTEDEAAFLARLEATGSD